MMTDEEFLAFCAEHEDLRVESNSNGDLEILPGVGPDTGGRNAQLGSQLFVWAKQDRRGTTFDSSTLFVLPSGARRSPDASWIAKSRIATLPQSQRGHLWHICPEFVIELRSPSDKPTILRAKMFEWIENGAQLGWLIDPVDQTVTIYRPGRDPEQLTKPASLAGEGPVAGFTLILQEIWEPEV